MTDFCRNIREFLFPPKLENIFTYSFEGDIPSEAEQMRLRNFLSFFGFRRVVFNEKRNYIFLGGKGLELRVTPGDVITCEIYSNGLEKFLYESGDLYLEWDNE